MGAMNTAERILCTKTITLGELEILADCLSELDGLKDYLISTRKAHVCRMIEQGHTIIERAAGEHASVIYGNDDTDPPRAAA